MKLVIFELKKLFSGKIKWILGAFLVVNFAVYYVYLMPFTPTKQEIELKKEWRQSIETYSDRTEEKLEFIQNVQQEFSSLSSYFFTQEFLEEKEKQQIIKKYKGTQYWSAESAMAVSRVLNQLFNEYQSVLDYQSFIDGMQERADKMMNVPIFAKKGNFSNRNIQKTANDFERMKDVSIEAVDGTGINAFQDFYLTDVFMLVLIVFLCFQQLGEDNRTGMSNLIQATPNGKGKLRFSQMRAIWIAVIGSGIILYGSNLLLTIGSFPFEESFSKYIQAIPTFRNVPFPLTVSQYFALYLLGKLAAAFFITAIFELLAVKLNGGSLTWILVGTLTTVSFLLWFFLPDSPMTKIFQYLNLVGIMDMKQILGNYQNLNLFSYPVSLLLAAIVTIIVISFTAIILTVNVQKIDWKMPKREKRANAKGHIWKSIFYYEQYKIVWKQKIWLIILLLFGIAVVGFQKEETSISTEEFFYNQYMNELEGVYTEEKNQYVQELVSNPEITNPDQRKAVAFLQTQIQNLQIQAEKSNHSNKIGFLNEKRFGKFLYHTETEMKNTIIIIIAVLFSLHSLFYQDKKTNMQQLLHTMPRSNPIYWNKIKIGVLLGGLYTIIIWSFVYAQYFLKYGIQNTDFLIQSLSKFETMPLTCSILEYMILSMIIRVLIGVYIGIVFTVLTELFVNPTQNIIIGIIIFILPIALAMIGNMGYQNPLVELINEQLAFLLKPVSLLTSLQCEWYRTSMVNLILFCLVPVIAMFGGYGLWKYDKRPLV